MADAGERSLDPVQARNPAADPRATGRPGP